MSSKTGSTISYVGSAPSGVILPGYTAGAFTVQAKNPADVITVTVVTSAGSHSVSNTHLSSTCQGVACGLAPNILVPAQYRLCTNPCPAGTNPNVLYHPPHPLLTTDVIQPVPAVTCNAQSLVGKNCGCFGCARGAGRGIAQQLYAAGCNVIATSRRPELYVNLTAPAVNQMWLDVTSQSSVDEFFDTVIAPLASLDLVVSTAGIASFAGLNGYTGNDILSLVNQNCIGHFRIITRALTKMGPANGYNKILVTTSTASFTPVPLTGPYAMSKSCARSLVWSYNSEVNAFPRYNIANNVSTVCGPNIVAPEIIAMAPASMKTGWGVYEYAKPTRQNTNDPRVAGDRAGSLGYIASAGMDPLDVGTQFVAIAEMPTSLTRVEYMVYNTFNPNSIDTPGQDIWNSATFNLPIGDAIQVQLNGGLGGFGPLVCGLPTYP